MSGKGFLSVLPVKNSVVCNLDKYSLAHWESQTFSKELGAKGL
jgi:hypothetical protein